MAFLKQTYVSGNLFVTGSENYISSSEFRGPLVGTASVADNINPNAEILVKSLQVSGNAVVGGDLQVNGDLTYVGVKDLRVKDKQIELNVDESGSASAAANGAGIIIRNSEAAGDIELIYSASDDKLHINKTVAGTIDSASRAVSAAEADKVAHKVTFKLKNQDGTQAADVEFDGSEAKDFSVDLSALETKTVVSASVADLQDQIDAITGGGSGSIDTKIQEAIEALDADASASAAGTAVSGGVFVLSGVAFNEADGKLTSGSATSVEVEKAGEAAKAKAELLGANTDATSSMTLNGVKKYAKTYTDDEVSGLSSSVATDIANVMLSQSADSQSISQSIATVAANALNLVESSSWIAVSEKANNKQTISAKTKEVASASAEGGNGLALALDVKEYVDAQVGGKNVSASGDEYINLSATDNHVTGSATIKSIADATAAKQGLVDAYDAKLHVSASVAAASASAASALNSFSESVATDFANAAATASANLAAATASISSSIGALSSSVATDFSASKADLTVTASALSESIAAVASASADAYVKKVGDTMTGDLNMGNNGIILGDMKLVWDASASAIVFVANS